MDMEKELRSLVKDSKYFQLSQCYNEGTADTPHDKGVMYKATIDVVDIKFPGPIPDEERLRVMLVRFTNLPIHVLQLERSARVCIPHSWKAPALSSLHLLYRCHSEHVSMSMRACVYVCMQIYGEHGRELISAESGMSLLRRIRGLEKFADEQKPTDYETMDMV